MFYRQCQLVKGNMVDTAYIPEKFAQRNRHLEIRDDNGWMVKWVSARRVSGDYLAAHEREYLNHRGVTDV